MNKDRQSYKWYQGRHLMVVLFSFVMFFLQAVLTAGCMNTVWPLIAEARGWNLSNIFAWNTPFTIITAFLTVPIGGLIAKKGPRLICSIGFVLIGIATICWGIVKNEASFILILGIVYVLILFNSQSNPTLISNWFPRTKGIVLGWTTMGIVCTDIFFSPYAPRLIAQFGINTIYMALGGSIIAFGILCYLLLRNNPEEYNCLPDNALIEDGIDPREELKKLEQYKGSWTIGKVLRTKEAWMIMLSFGLMWCACGTFMSQIVARIVSIGYQEMDAIRIMQYAAIAALIGSFTLGSLDQKLGTKRACQIFCVWIGLMFVSALLMRQGMVFVWIAAMGIMFGTGAVANLMPSMIISVWGRQDFIFVQRIIQCGVSLLISGSFLLIALRSVIPGGFDTLYAMFIIFAIIGFICLSRVGMSKYQENVENEKVS